MRIPRRQLKHIKPRHLLYGLFIIAIKAFILYDISWCQVRSPIMASSRCSLPSIIEHKPSRHSSEGNRIIIERIVDPWRLAFSLTNRWSTKKYHHHHVIHICLVRKRSNLHAWYLINAVMTVLSYLMLVVSEFISNGKFASVLLSNIQPRIAHELTFQERCFRQGKYPNGCKVALLPIVTMSSRNDLEAGGKRQADPRSWIGRTMKCYLL